MLIRVGGILVYIDSILPEETLINFSFLEFEEMIELIEENEAYSKMFYFTKDYSDEDWEQLFFAIISYSL